MVNEIGADDLLIHHFSLGSRASRTAFALPCRMMLVYHNITPPEYFLGVHDQLVRQCYHGRRELLPYRSRCELALGDSEFNRQELEALGFPRTAVLPVVPDFTHLDVTPDTRVLDAYDDEWTNIAVRRPADSQQAARQPDPLLPRLPDAVQPPHAPDPGRLATAASRRTSPSCTRSSRDAGRHRRRHPRPGHQRRADGALRRRRPVPLRERARRLLRPADRGVLQGRAGRRPTPRRRCRPRWTAAACCTTAPIRARSRRLSTRLLSNPALEAEVLARRTPRSARLLAQDFDGLVVEVRRSGTRRRHAAAPAVAYDFWRQFKLAEELEAIRQARPSAFQALPLAPDAGHVSPTWATAHDRQPVAAGGASRRRGRRQRADAPRVLPRSRAHVRDLRADASTTT